MRPKHQTTKNKEQITNDKEPKTKRPSPFRVRALCEKYGRSARGV
jgi:hypothetical protein